MKEIKVLINKGGIFEGVYVSPGLEDADVELIDFVTDDPDEYDEAAEKLKSAEERTEKGELKAIWH